MKELSVSAQAPRALPALVRLMRPANIVTAYADILAGCAAAGAAETREVGLLLLATTGLYGGGVVLNDVFDARLDSSERPERPIPSGAVSVRTAAVFGSFLLACGVGIAFVSSQLSGIIALATALAVILYDVWGKHQSILGPANMGLCRGLNLVLGISVAGHIPALRAPLGLVTLCYIAGITALSRGEVRGGTRTAANISIGWLAACVIVLGVLISRDPAGLVFAAPILIVMLVRIAKPFWNAFQTLEPLKIRVAIKTGVLSLIMLDASLAALYGGLWFGVGTLLLYVPAILLARLFAVT